jgi:predicted nuclease with TOPRIM domain
VTKLEAVAAELREATEELQRLSKARGTLIDQMEHLYREHEALVDRCQVAEERFEKARVAVIATSAGTDDPWGNSWRERRRPYRIEKR